MTIRLAIRGSGFGKGACKFWFQLCEYDQVNVSSLLSNGKYKPHGSFCGTKRPSLIFSESSVLEIRFGSDDSVQQTGFAAVYYIGKPIFNILPSFAHWPYLNLPLNFYSAFHILFSQTVFWVVDQF